MSRLDAIDDALRALADLLDDRGHDPACVCTWCEASRSATQLLPQLDHLVGVLEAWARADAEEPLLPQDIGRLLLLLGEETP